MTAVLGTDDVGMKVSESLLSIERLIQHLTVAVGDNNNNCYF